MLNNKYENNSIKLNKLIIIVRPKKQKIKPK